VVLSIVAFNQYEWGTQEIEGDDENRGPEESQLDLHETRDHFDK
jgi:hypothetical protein